MSNPALRDGKKVHSISDAMEQGTPATFHFLPKKGGISPGGCLQSGESFLPGHGIAGRSAAFELTSLGRELQMLQHSLRRLSAVLFLIVLCPTAAKAQTLDQLDTALRRVPSDAAFFSTKPRNKKQIDLALRSKAWQKLW